MIQVRDAVKKRDLESNDKKQSILRRGKCPIKSQLVDEDGSNSLTWHWHSKCSKSVHSELSSVCRESIEKLSTGPSRARKANLV
ncbi:hypothetical protein KIN20_037945 [Parelaphostrongylus tenuis]|uniref:Uncharacterized protein n=1 Tax=Parelaphostrongylus tenuis TaxID=148309 RepID=A0AAD5WMM2_PARTN|nr:hypothetical protein KIN20_037945 [Parelaphostrongylus tenuis]